MEMATGVRGSRVGLLGIPYAYSIQAHANWRKQVDVVFGPWANAVVRGMRREGHPAARLEA